MKKIIVNADDFGRSPEVNLAIVKCFELGYIQRTTLMVNMPYSDEAVQLAKENNFFNQVGLHINLGEGHPINEKSNSSFLCSGGIFNSCINRRRLPAWRIILNKREQSIIRDEIESQIIKYKEYGFECNHFDSHRHVHYNMGVLFSVVRLVKKYGFKSIRVRNRNQGGSFIERLLYNWIVRKLGLKHTDYFYSLRKWKKMKDVSFFKNYTVELSVHPFLSSDEKIMDSEGILLSNMVGAKDENYNET